MALINTLFWLKILQTRTILFIATFCSNVVFPASLPLDLLVFPPLLLRYPPFPLTRELRVVKNFGNFLP